MQPDTDLTPQPSGATPPQKPTTDRPAWMTGTLPRGSGNTWRRTLHHAPAGVHDERSIRALLREPITERGKIGTAQPREPRAIHAGRVTAALIAGTGAEAVVVATWDWNRIAKLRLPRRSWLALARWHARTERIGWPTDPPLAWHGGQ